MKKLEQFVDDNINYFNNLGNSEVEVYSADNFDSDVIDYLKSAHHNRFDYNGICVYYVESTLQSKDVSVYKNEVWVENMNS